DTLRVVDRDGDMPGECLQELDLRPREGVQLVVGRIKDPDDAVPDLQRNDEFGAGLRLADAIMQLLRDIGSVMRTAREDDLARQTFGHRPTLTFARLRAAMHGGEMESIALDQQNVGFNAAKLDGNAVDDVIKELVEVKNRGDLLRCPLH